MFVHLVLKMSGAFSGWKVDLKLDFGPMFVNPP